MARKKKEKTASSFSEAIGLKNIFQNDIFNFIFGFVLVLLAVYMVTAFISFFSTAQADQSLVLDLKPGEWLNGGTSLPLLHYEMFRSFGLPDSRVHLPCRIAHDARLQQYKPLQVVPRIIGVDDLVLSDFCEVSYTAYGRSGVQSRWRARTLLLSVSGECCRFAWYHRCADSSGHFVPYLHQLGNHQRHKKSPQSRWLSEKESPFHH